MFSNIAADFPFCFRGGISVVTESGEETKSHLVIRNARQADEVNIAGDCERLSKCIEIQGNYTCTPSIFKPAQLRLFVIDGGR